MPELYPPDSELLAYSGATDSQQEVLFPAVGESPYYMSFYKMLYRLLDVSRRAGDLRVYKDGDLTFGVRAGKFMDGPAVRDVAGVTGQALAANQTNFIYLTAAGAIAVNQTGFPSPDETAHVPLASILTGAASYAQSDITDYRGRSMMGLLNALTAAQANQLVAGGNADNLHTHTTGDVPDRSVTAAKLGYAPDAVVLVQRGSTNAASGTNLLNAYAYAKTLTPGGNAKSATNRVCLLIPPGTYALTPLVGQPAMELNALADANGKTGEYVDLVGMDPRQYGTVITTNCPGATYGCTLYQTAADVQLFGLTISNTGPANNSTGAVPPLGSSAFVVNVAGTNANKSSIYRYLTLVGTGAVYQNTSDDSIGSPCYFLSDNKGTWENCYSPSGFAWRSARNWYPIASASRNGSTVTLTVTAGHAFHAGETITIAGSSDSGINGQFSILSSPAPTCTTVAVTSAGAAGPLTIGSSTTAATNKAIITNITRTGDVSTATCTANHGLAFGDLVRITGMSDSSFNTTVQMTGYGETDGDVDYAKFTFDSPGSDVSVDAAVNTAWAKGPGRLLGGTFFRCIGVSKDFGGDRDGVTITARMTQCESGDSGFGGCTLWGCDIGYAAYLDGCVAKATSYAMGMNIAGTIVRSRGAGNCFAGYAPGIYHPRIWPTAMLQDVSADSAGNSFAAGDPANSVSGALIRVRCAKMAATMYLKAATLIGCDFKATVDNVDCIKLLDSGSKLYRNTFIAGGSGTVYSISAASAQTAVAAHNLTNKGLSNVTLTANAGNVDSATFDLP